MGDEFRFLCEHVCAGGNLSLICNDIGMLLVAGIFKDLGFCQSRAKKTSNFPMENGMDSSLASSLLSQDRSEPMNCSSREGEEEARSSLISHQRSWQSSSLSNSETEDLTDDDPETGPLVNVFVGSMSDLVSVSGHASKSDLTALMFRSSRPSVESEGNSDLCVDVVVENCSGMEFLDVELERQRIRSKSELVVS